jgi:hypothetical protein
MELGWMEVSVPMDILHGWAATDLVNQHAESQAAYEGELPQTAWLSLRTKKCGAGKP